MPLPDGLNRALSEKSNGGANPDLFFSWPDPQPLPVGLPPVEPFAFEMLPDSFIPWISDIAARMQCAPDYPAVAAMVCL